MTARRRAFHAITRNPPPDWGNLFAYVPGRSSKVRCLLCGATGYGPHGPVACFDGSVLPPVPWQIPHILGHPVQCLTCRRPFISYGAVRSHQTCKLHHDCCGEHTTVPTWKNPFTGARP